MSKKLPKKKVQRIGNPVGLDPKDLKNEEERAQYVYDKMQEVCAMTGMKIEAKVVPQLEILPTRPGTLKECLDEYNKPNKDDGNKAIPKER